jgi:hypothetical protein
LVVALIGLSASSCYGYASIERRSAASLEARIDCSDGESLYVTTEDGSKQMVKRADVVEISHAGKGAFSCGILLAAAGASMVTYGLVHPWCRGGTRTVAKDCGYSIEQWMWIEGGVLALLSGGGFVAAGVSAHHNSVRAAALLSITPSTQAMQAALPQLTCSFCARSGSLSSTRR